MRDQLPRYAIVAASTAIAVLALLALEDLTTNAQPSYAAEWTMLAFATVWFGALAVLGVARRERRAR